MHISVLAKCCHASHSEVYTIQLLDATNLKMESYANHVKTKSWMKQRADAKKMNLLLLCPRHRHRRRHRERMKLRVEEGKVLKVSWMMVASHSLLWVRKMM